MKKIIKRSSMEQLLRKMTSTNAYTILCELENVTDYEGKNPLIAALEGKMYTKFLLMISPVQYQDPKLGETYRIFFDPFNACVFENKEGLNWPIDDSLYPAKEGDYTNIVKTRVNFYSPYSAYNYICHIKDKAKRQSLIEACHHVDHELIGQIAMKNIPAKDQKNNIKIYTEEDYIRYVPYPLQNALRTLIDKNIPISKWGIEKKISFLV